MKEGERGRGGAVKKTSMLNNRYISRFIGSHAFVCQRWLSAAGSHLFLCRIWLLAKYDILWRTYLDRSVAAR